MPSLPPLATVTGVSAASPHPIHSLTLSVGPPRYLSSQLLPSRKRSTLSIVCTLVVNNKAKPSRNGRNTNLTASMHERLPVQNIQIP